MAQESGGQRGDLVSYFCASMSENTGQRVLCIWVGSQVKGLAWSIGDQVGNCICVYCNQMKWRNLILWLGKPWVWKASVLFIMAMAVGQHLLVSEIIMTSWLISIRCCCSVTRSCLTLCDPMYCSTPGFPVFHCLPEFAQTQVHCQRYHPIIYPLSPPSLSSVFPSIRVLSKS